MLDETLRSAFVVLIAAGLKIAADAIGIALDAATLAALAAAIVAWIFGNSLGNRTAQAITVNRNTRAQ
jgi:biopolymer transport protein ExbB/TolQ